MIQVLNKTEEWFIWSVPFKSDFYWPSLRDRALRDSAIAPVLAKESLFPPVAVATWPAQHHIL